MLSATDGSPAAARRSESGSPLARASEPLPLTSAAQAGLVAAARSDRLVEGLTHRHYRYPARFSPVLAKRIIETFTRPGDLVLDPFNGGGTTVVEAMAADRRALGTDISTLATFVSRAKTLLPGAGTLEKLEPWVAEMAALISMRRDEPEFPGWSEKGYFRNMGSSTRWRLRKAISQSVHAIEALGDPDLETLARCVVLRTSHWALDGRKRLPGVDHFRRALVASARDVTAGTAELVAAVGSAPFVPRVINRSVIGMNADAQVMAAGRPDLILTSPPYPGVHVLYHRWQVDGRKESPAPFFIANALDGSGESYYTMGGRKAPGLPAYFQQLGDALAALSALAGPTTTLVQVVAFAQPEWQLARYLDTAASAGWRELQLPLLAGHEDGRLWRTVPNRKWYADQRGVTPGAREVVLFHRPA
jgi:hypothetical protein